MQAQIVNDQGNTVDLNHLNADGLRTANQEAQRLVHETKEAWRALTLHYDYEFQPEEFSIEPLS